MSKFDDVLGTKNKLRTGAANSIIDEAVSSAIQNQPSVLLPIEQIVVNEEQPRKFFDKESLDSLKQSIEQYGLIQPLVVYYDRNKDRRAILVAGERRLRACRELGDKFKEVPVFILEDKEMLNELALIENVQREDLSAVERADAITKLKNDKNYDYESLGKIIGKSQDTVRALEKVANLPEDIKQTSREIKIALRELIKLERIEDKKEQAKAFNQLKKKYVNVDELSVPQQRTKQKKDLKDKVKKAIKLLKNDIVKMQKKEYLSLKDSLDELLSEIEAINKKFEI